MMDTAKELLDRIRWAVADALTDETGAVLSGGIDSSTIVSLAGSLPTFTGYYEGEAYDERPYARLVAGAEHHEILIRPEDFVEHFDDMLRAARPPYQGMGTFGQYMVARYASYYVDRVLSGEGGDELFGGYCRLLMVAGCPRPDGYEDYELPEGYPKTLKKALAWDWERLPQLLAVDEQMTSAFGLEAVAPFTDSRVVEFVMTLPPEQRVGKKLLKEAMKGIVPDEILARTDKRGFPCPLVDWANRDTKVREFVRDRIGYIPDHSKPWAREWWVELCEVSKQRVEAAA
jgi:asparagine synthase (glutamine-hydrolysing)